jgi:malonyl-CoA O-methyltransferase
MAPDNPAHRAPSAAAPRIRRGFNRRAATYDQSAGFARAVGTELVERLQWLAFVPASVLDLGAGTAFASRALKARYPRAQVIALDVAERMLLQAPSSWWRPIARICADAARLPLKSDSMDLICSSLLLPWLLDPTEVLAEAVRVLSPRGCLTFATIGPQSLVELTQAFASLDGWRHRNPLPDMTDLAQLLVQTGFADPVLDIERETHYCASTRDLLRLLHGTGCGVLGSGQRPGLLGRDALKTLEAAYERDRTAAGLPVSIEVIYGQAWRPGARGPERGRRGEVTVPFASIRR